MQLLLLKMLALAAVAAKGGETRKYESEFGI